VKSDIGMYVESFNFCTFDIAHAVHGDFFLLLNKKRHIKILDLDRPYFITIWNFDLFLILCTFIFSREYHLYLHMPAHGT
jgi:hypothetical protein